MRSAACIWPKRSPTAPWRTSRNALRNRLTLRCDRAAPRIGAGEASTKPVVKTCYNMRCHKSVAGAWSRRVNAQPARFGATLLILRGRSC